MQQQKKAISLEVNLEFLLANESFDNETNKKFMNRNNVTDVQRWFLTSYSNI